MLSRGGCEEDAAARALVLVYLRNTRQAEGMSAHSNNADTAGSSNSGAPRARGKLERKMTTTVREPITVTKREFSKADTDQSGGIDFAEFAAIPINQGTDQAALKALFDSIDENHDGILDMEEFNRWRSMKKGKRESKRAEELEAAASGLVAEKNTVSAAANPHSSFHTASNKGLVRTDSWEARTKGAQKTKTLKQKAFSFATHKYFVITMLFATVAALFAMDLWELCGPPPIENDIMIYVLMAVTFILFLLEFSLMTWSKPGYRLSFFWWLDMLATVSLVPDALMLVGFNIIAMLGDSTSTLAITRAGRAARAGTRAVRIIEEVKKQLKLRRMRKQGLHYDPEEDEESAIGGKLGDGITEKVILIVALMLIAGQVFV